MKTALFTITAPTRAVLPPSNAPKLADMIVENAARRQHTPYAGATRQQQPRHSARRNAGSDGEDGDSDSDDGGQPDELVPDPQVCREFNVSAMTLWRWDRDPALNFPARISIRGRNFRSRKQIEAFKRRLLRGAIVQRSRELEGA
jgi:hypothetical protein